MGTDRILGIGIDVVSLARLAAAYRRHGTALVDRICAPAEAGAVLDAASPVDQLAIRFAFKEAALKALGTGWAAGLAFRQVETDPVRGIVLLTGPAATRAERIGIERWIGDSSRTDRTVVAWVMALGQDPEAR